MDLREFVRLFLQILVILSNLKLHLTEIAQHRPATDPLHADLLGALNSFVLGQIGELQTEVIGNAFLSDPRRRVVPLQEIGSSFYEQDLSLVRDICLAEYGRNNHVFATLTIRLRDPIVNIVAFRDVEPIQHRTLFCDDYGNLQVGSSFDVNRTRLHLHFMDPIPRGDDSIPPIQERNGERFVLFHCRVDTEQKKWTDNKQA